MNLNDEKVDHLQNDLEAYQVDHLQNDLEAYQADHLQNDLEAYQADHLQNDLEAFREKWQEEVTNQNRAVVLKHQDATDIELKAAQLFLEGSKHETNGDVHTALYYYRQAVRLVPDIEFKINYDELHKQQTGKRCDESEDEEEENYAEDESEVFGIENAMSQLNIKEPCQPEYEQVGLHISALPTELLIVLIRWIISSHLDIKSLQRFSYVCRWFHVCSHEDELWKDICKRVWGNSCKRQHHFTWMKLYTCKPRVRFNGVYISMNSFVRYGSQGMNSFYRPSFLIEYAKYLRFYADGTVTFYTSPDPPRTVVELLRRRDANAEGFHRGRYHMTSHNEVLVYYVHTTKPQSVHEENNRRRNKRKEKPEVREYHFYMKLRLEDQKRHRNRILNWTNYSYQVMNKKTGETSEESVGTEFKPYVFSIVRSYHNQASSAL